MAKHMIVHSVFFRLNHDLNTADETVFFEKAAGLAGIPGVINFKVLKEISPKNPFTFGFSMSFSDQAAYDSYSRHPDHIDFVQKVWLNDVAEFQEIDYIERHP
jgi:quinol monooxygenase YgiN